ncbi:MAG: hypothetical protein JW884_14705 [Deltaproteobacteria bacterium]|nr:hypothetical protein [Deltaproteobacteria bacterium]
MADELRANGENVLLIDGGNIIGRNKKYSEQVMENIGALAIESMNLIDYGAINIGSDEMTLGIETMKRVLNKAAFPAVASNILFKDQTASYAKPYALIKQGNLTIGVLGVMSPRLSGVTALNAESEEIQVIEAEAALAKLLPEVRNQSDIVLLLSQLSTEETQKLASTVRGIDLIVASSFNSAGKSDLPAGSCAGSTTIAEVTGKSAASPVPVFIVSPDGAELGAVTIEKTSDGRVDISNERVIKLSKRIEDSEVVVAILGTEISSALQKKLTEQVEKEMSEIRKLSPEEFIRRTLMEKGTQGGKKQ